MREERKNKFVLREEISTRCSYICLCFVLFRAIKRSNCFHKSGGKDPCHMSSNGYMITFGIIEVLFSQIPDFDQVWWLSIVAAVMSFTYSSVGLGLGIGKVAGIDIGKVAAICKSHLSQSYVVIYSTM